MAEYKVVSAQIDEALVLGNNLGEGELSVYSIAGFLARVNTFPLLLRTVVLVSMLVGCATGYHTHGLGGGFSELRLSQRAWQVSFSGNGYTSPDRAHTFALRRAAELTLASGYQAFYVGRENEGVQQIQIEQPVNCYTNGPYTNCSGGGAETINKPSTRLTITMVTGPEAAQAPPGYMVYDAQLLLAQIPTD